MDDDYEAADHEYINEDEEQEILDGPDAVEIGDTEITFASSGKNYSNEVLVVPNDKRMSSDTLSYFEIAELTSQRAGQIEMTGVTFVDVGDLTDPIKIAQKEFDMRRIPILIRRPAGEVYNEKTGLWHKCVEVWDPNLMDRKLTFTK